MANVQTVSRVEATKPPGEDHCGVFTKGDYVLLVVADGAGGQHGGEAASRFVVDQAAKRLNNPGELVDPIVWVSWMTEVDQAINSDPNKGETTAVICVVENGQFIGGAS